MGLLPRPIITVLELQKKNGGGLGHHEQKGSINGHIIIEIIFLDTFLWAAGLASIGTTSATKSKSWRS